jgi:hypothetical protein
MAAVGQRFELLDDGDILWAWRERMLDLYDGYARKANRVLFQD